MVRFGSWINMFITALSKKKLILILVCILSLWIYLKIHASQRHGKSVEESEESTERSVLNPNILTSEGAQTLREEARNSSVKSSLSQHPLLFNSTAPGPAPSSPSTAVWNDTAKDNASPKLLCVYPHARLGNQLFQYASALGLALASNRTAVFLKGYLQHILKNFSGGSATLFPSPELEERCRKAREMMEKTCCKYSENFTRLDPNYDYRIGRFLQSYRYFDKYRAQIRKAITFNDNIQQNAKAKAAELRKRYPSSTLIGVHVRRGDNATPFSQRLGYPVASPEYINRSLAYFSGLYHDCVFVVASDGLHWCKENFPTSYRVHYLENNGAVVDMLLLRAMDHVILTFGTFSWWIGYLNSGMKVYMKDFIKPGSRFAKLFHPGGQDYWYPGWIPL